MLELRQSPSYPDELLRKLTELQLCRPADFRRAKVRVRRLVHDLPAFDSVWIDALIQLRCLTPFQGSLVDAGQAEKLRVGPYVIVDQIGHGPISTTYLARRIQRDDLVALKQVQVSADRVLGVRSRFQQYQEQLKKRSVSHVVVPQLTDSDDPNSIVLVSPFIDGLTLSELLVRRGRFPWQIVLEIARQLTTGLSESHNLGLCHGDIKLGNVRLTNSGMALLVDSGLRQSIYTEVTVHDALALESYDGIAPELIGTGVRPNGRSEMYAFGCMLWQLLTGRPPYPTADSLMKLAAHQSQRIPDVRTWAPDTPASLAVAIFEMTSPVPDERPKSFDELLRRWGRASVFSRSRLKEYRRQFDGGIPHLALSEQPSSTGRYISAAAILLMVAGVMTSVIHPGVRSELLAIQHKFAVSLKSLSASGNRPNNSNQAGSDTVNTGEEGDVLRLPNPDESGEIVLSKPGPYVATSIESNHETLTIRPQNGVHPTIEIRDAELKLTARTVKISGIRVERHGEQSSQKHQKLVYAYCNDLLIDGCTFSGNSVPAAENANLPIAVAWKKWSGPGSDDANRESHLSVVNCVWKIPCDAIGLAENPHRIEVSNSLKLGRGAFISLASKSVSKDPLDISLANVTLRETGSLMKISHAFANSADAAPIQMKSEKCLFHLATRETGLFEVHSKSLRNGIVESIQMTGDSFVTARQPTIVWVDSNNLSEPIADADDQFEELQLAEQVEFKGLIDGSLEQSALIIFRADGRRPNRDFPGVDVGQLPSW